MGNIYLYIDKKDFLSDNQQNQLRKEFSFNILIRKTRYKMSWGGPKVIINELTAFKEILKDINSNDYLAKVDSDILFISDNIFKKIIKSKNLLIGQRITKENGLRYSSGGCYFLKSSIIPKITNYPLYNIIKKTIKQDRCRIDSIPEDLTIFNLVKKKTNKIDLRKDIFLLPLEKLDKILKKGKQKYSVIHFFKCKDDMLDVIKKL